jgi:hypothetical protein
LRYLSAYQASARGVEVSVWLNGDRVILDGNAVAVLRGFLHHRFLKRWLFTGGWPLMIDD